MPSEVVQDAIPSQVTPSTGKGALGTWRSQGDARTQSRDKSALEVGTSPEVNHSREGCMWASTLASPGMGRLPEERPRSERYSGNPTVPDRRGARGNVGVVRAPPRVLEGHWDSQLVTCYAPRFYPDTYPPTYLSG
jgi:hypothetical protein